LEEEEGKEAWCTACAALGGKSRTLLDINRMDTLSLNFYPSATLDLAYTAMGAFDIWWEGGCWEW